MESKQKFLKAKFKDTKKIISYTESFESFLKNLETSFKISLYPLETSSFSVSYLDDEEDLINIENAFDYQEALKFAENSNQNFLNFFITLKNQSLANLTIKKDNKENFEFIEANYSLRSQELQKSPQIEFLIPKGQKADLIKIQKLEDLKFFVDENQNAFSSKRFKSKKNFINEDTILSKSPEISIDLPKQPIASLLSSSNTKENFEITYDSSNNNGKDKEKAKKRLQANEVRNENNFKLEKMKKKKSEKKEKVRKEKPESVHEKQCKSVAIEDLISLCLKSSDLKINYELNPKSEFDELKENNQKQKQIYKNSKKAENEINNGSDIKENEIIAEAKENKKEIKKLAKALVKKAVSEELRSVKKEIEFEITEVISKNFEALLKKNFEAQKKLSEMQNNISKLSGIVNEEKSAKSAAHLGFACKSCQQAPLLGIRFKCSVCKDFDLCEACEETCAQAHPHPFIKIRSQELNPAFIKTVLFDDYNGNSDDFNNSSNNFANNVNNNCDEKNRYVEKYIDLDFNNNNNNNNNNLNSYNCFNLEANNQMLNYLRNSAYNNNFIKNNNYNNKCNNGESQKSAIKPTENSANSNNSNCTSTNSNFNINNISKPSNFTNFINNNFNNNISNNKNNNKNLSLTEDKYKITCLNSSEIFEIKNSKAKEFKITMKLHNTGKTTIPRPCYLECVSSQSEIIGKAIPINVSLKPGMNVNLELTLDIVGLRKGVYLSVWRMQTSQREFFGEEIPLKIKIEKTEELKIKENFVEKNLNFEANSENEKINFNELLRRNKISEINLPLQKGNNEKEKDLNSSYSSQNTKIISLEEFKKLKIFKKKNSEKISNSEKVDLDVKKETKDLFALADEIIKKHPLKIINRKMLINALFRTGGNEKNSIEMATNESHNVCGYYNKHMFN